MFSNTVNNKLLDKKIKSLESNLKKNSQESLYKLGGLIVSDAVNKPPTPRIDTGNARGSFSISVGNKVFENNKKGKSLNPSLSSNPFELRVGFNMPYAKNIEFGYIINSKGKKLPMGFGVKSQNAKPSTGNFFLKTKLKNKKEIYVKKLGEFFGDTL